jgi:two-component system, NtrC family, response regulator AtoC
MRALNNAVNHHPHSEVSIATRRTASLLIVDDNEPTCKQLQKLLQVNPMLKVDYLTSGNNALKELECTNYSILLTDLRMPDMPGMELIRAARDRGLPVTIIVTTGHGSIDDAVQAIRLGAYDFLTKPIDVEHLRLVIERALRERALLDELAAMRSEMKSKYSFHNILSKNPKMHAVFELVGNVAQTNTTVLIEGETGTGKEQLARALHASSHERPGPFVAVNCAALPETLLESELFGHEKGAFTNALGQRRGRFELADGGTIFLDEIGDVPATMQAKLLRVLQERSFERVGGAESIQVDVRVIAATNRSLANLVKEGKFREDLFYRLNVVKILLPPLRERPEDIPLLVTHFILKYSQAGEPSRQIAPNAMEVLLRHSWPGNVRELENAIERACVTSRDPVIHVENLPPELLAQPQTDPPVICDLNKPLANTLDELVAQVERQYIQMALKKTLGHVGRCAQLCGLSRRSITKKISEYQLNKAVFKELV